MSDGTLKMHFRFWVDFNRDKTLCVNCLPLVRNLEKKPLTLIPTSPADSSEQSKRRRRRSSSEPIVRDARKSRERWSGRRHKVQSWVTMLTAGMVVLVGLNSLVEILTDSRFIPNIYPVLIGIAVAGLLVWFFFRSVEFIIERRYNAVSQRSKASRRNRKERNRQRSKNQEGSTQPLS